VSTKTKGWRELEADLIESQVETIRRWLDQTDELIEMFAEADDDQATAELRGVSGLIRMKRNDLNSKAAELRIEIAERMTFAERTGGQPR
jgi:hypothetical protein